MKTITAHCHFLVLLLALLVSPFSAQAQSNCYPVSQSIPGSYSGSITYSMNSCMSGTTDSTMDGKFTFSNFAETAGESMSGSYSFTSSMNISSYTSTYTINGGPLVYTSAGGREEIYYDQLSYTIKIDPASYQVSFLNTSGGWRLNGVYYPASSMTEYMDFSGGMPTLDTKALSNITPPNTTSTSDDTTPASFSLAAASQVAPGAVVESGAIVVQGINASASISISGGQYSINGGSWTSSAGKVALGNQVKVRLTAPSSYNATASAVLSIGGVTAQFNVSTQTFTRVNSATEVFTNPQTATVVNGIVRFSAPPSTPLQLASNAVPNAVIAIDTNAAIPVLSGTTTLNYSRNSSDTTLQIKTVDGAPALTPIAGSVNIAAPAANSTIPLSSGTNGSASLQTSAASTQVTAGRDANRNLVVAVTTGPVTYKTSSRGRALPSQFTVYPGEAVLADDGGSPGQVRLGSFAQNGSQAGDFITGLQRAASNLQVPLVSGSSQRYGNNWTDLVGQAIASKLGLGSAQSLTQDARSGVMTLVTSSGTYRFLPVGSLAIAASALSNSRAVAVADIAVNLTAILDAGLSFAVAPATAYADMEAALKNISSSARLEILGDGVLLANLNGTDYIAQPAARTSAGNLTGCPGFVTENNQLALCDSDGKRQVLHAAFADSDTLRSTFKTDLPSLSITNTGSNGTYAASVGSTTLTLTPDITLTTPPATQAGKLWWQAQDKFFIRYSNGTSQGFGVR